MKTKIILTLVFMLVVATIFAGCGNNGTAEVTDTPTYSAVAEEVIRPSEASKNAVESDFQTVTENVTTAFVAESEENGPTESEKPQQEPETTADISSENTQTEATEPFTKIKDKEPQINFSDLV